MPRPPRTRTAHVPNGSLSFCEALGALVRPLPVDEAERSIVKPDQHERASIHRPRNGRVYSRDRILESELHRFVRFNYEVVVELARAK